MVPRRAGDGLHSSTRQQAINVVRYFLNMKCYFFIAIVLLGCKNKTANVVSSPIEKDTTSRRTVKPDSITIDIHDPYLIGKDTVRLNIAIDQIFNFPEVKAITKQILKNSKGKHGTTIMTRDEFGNDTLYYWFRVGDNSLDDRYVNIFNFVMDKKTGEIKAYDSVNDSIMSLKDWRKGRK